MFNDAFIESNKEGKHIEKTPGILFHSKLDDTSMSIFKGRKLHHFIYLFIFWTQINYPPNIIAISKVI